MHIRHDWLLAALVACSACKSHDESSPSQRESKLELVSRGISELDAQIVQAERLLASATTDADRSAAQARLTKLTKERDEWQRRIAAAKEAAAKGEQGKGVHISKECLENPLMKGCS